MPEIKLYQFGPVPGRESASPFCVKVHYALRYKRLPFEVVNLATPGQSKKLNSRGKLPVLTYDGKPIGDSTDIIRFIEEHHPEPRLYPQDPRARANALLLEDWGTNRSTGTRSMRIGWWTISSPNLQSTWPRLCRLWQGR